MSSNLISGLRNMLEDIEKLGAGPLTVDTNLIREAIAVLHGPPDGFVLLPINPTPGRLMSMAIRRDHALGCPGYYDQEMLQYPGAPTHQQTLDMAIREARSQYEEVVGHGFYSPEKESQYVRMYEAGNAQKGVE